MAVMNGGASENPTGGLLSSPPASIVDDGKEQSSTHRELRDITLYGVFIHLIESIFEPNPDLNSGTLRPPMANRVKKSLMETAPMFREAILNTRRDVLRWTRRGSPLRALLVVSVGIVALLGLTGMLVFTLFVVLATVNAIVISLLISLAAAGGFLAIFFTCLTAFYIFGLCVAAFVTFTITISSIIAAFVAAGWIGFFWFVWLVVSKSATLAKHSLTIAGRTFPPNVPSSQHNARNIKEP